MQVWCKQMFTQQNLYNLFCSPSALKLLLNFSETQHNLRITNKFQQQVEYFNSCNY